MNQQTTSHKTKEQLLQECVDHMKYGTNINPIRVQQMINEAFNAGYNEAVAQKEAR